MSNAPDYDEHIVLKGEERKLTYTLDTKIADTGNFKLLKEDHTVGNLITRALLEDSRVLFAGYRMPHPLENVMNIKIQTRTETTPPKVLSHCINNLCKELTSLEEMFTKEVDAVRQQGQANAMQF